MGCSKAVPDHIIKLHGLPSRGGRSDGAEIKIRERIGKRAPVRYLLAKGPHQKPDIGCLAVDEQKHAGKPYGYKPDIRPHKGTAQGLGGMAAQKNMECEPGQQSHQAEPNGHLLPVHLFLFHPFRPLSLPFFCLSCVYYTVQFLKSYDYFLNVFVFFIAF